MPCQIPSDACSEMRIVLIHLQCASPRSPPVSSIIHTTTNIHSYSSSRYATINRLTLKSRYHPRSLQHLTITSHHIPVPTSLLTWTLQGSESSTRLDLHQQFVLFITSPVISHDPQPGYTDTWVVNPTYLSPGILRYQRLKSKDLDTTRRNRDQALAGWLHRDPLSLPLSRWNRTALGRYTR